MKKKQKIILISLVVVVTLFIVCYLFQPKFSKDNVGTYYKKSDGTYATNEWVKRFSDWYYFDGNGYMVKGQITPDEYYTDYKTGKMMKNYWLSVNGKYYYFDENGKFTRDRWIKYKNNYFYITSAGEMATNKWINNEFYVGQDGAMLVNTTTPDGNTVGSDGRVVYLDKNSDNIINNVISKNKTKIVFNGELLDIYNSNSGNCKFDEKGNLWICTGPTLNGGPGDGITIKYADGVTEEHYEFSGYASPNGGHVDYYTQVISGEKQSVEVRDGINYGQNDIIKNVEIKINQYKNLNDTYIGGISAEKNELGKQMENFKIVLEYGDITIDYVDSIQFGKYQKNDNSLEPIDWVVLDKKDGKAFLLSKYIIDYKNYDADYEALFKRTDGTTWETCSIRKWLNGAFYNSAFDENEKKNIEVTNVINDDNEKYSTEAGNDTKDKIFLLSIDETKKYFTNENIRKTSSTLYASAKEIISEITELTGKTKGGNDYLLRSPGGGKDYVSLIKGDGDISYYGTNYADPYHGIRPAMWIKYKK